MEVNGFVAPVLARRDSEGIILLDGHARVEIVDPDWGVPTLILNEDVDDDQAKVILLAFDHITGMAKIDTEKLASLIKETKDLIHNPQLQAMVEQMRSQHGIAEVMPTPGDGGDEFDTTPVDGPTRAQPGDLWIFGGLHRLFVGSSTLKDNVEKLMGDSKPFMMVTDPPYGVNYDPKWREDYDPRWTYATGAVSNDHKADWLEAYKLFTGPVAYIWHTGIHAGTVAANLQEAGFVIRSQIIWNKPAFVFGRGAYHWKHEPCWYAVRDGETARWVGDRTQSTIWDIFGMGVAKMSTDSADTRTDHSTQKPIECMAKPIRNHGSKGDIIYDPFLGSGTTMIAAHREGRICYGCELEPKYADIIIKRAEAEGLVAERVGWVDPGQEKPQGENRPAADQESPKKKPRGKKKE